MSEDELSRAIQRALRVLLDHLPAGEIDENRTAYFIDHERERVVLTCEGADYWLERGFAVRQRGGMLTYFKNRRAYSSPPPSEN